MFTPKQLFQSVFHGLRFRLLLPVVLSCVPLVVLTLHEALNERRLARYAWIEQAERLAHIAEREEKTIVGTTRQFLTALAESSPVQAGNQRAAQKLLEHLSSSYDRYSSLALLSTNGESLASSGPIPPELAQKSFFQKTVHSVAFSAEIVPKRDGISRPLHFAHPVLDSISNVQSIVFAGLNPEWLQGINSEMLDHLPPGAFWFQLDAAGTVLSSFSNDTNQMAGAYPELSKELFRSRRAILEPEGKFRGMVFASAPMQSYLPNGVVLGVLGAPRKILFAQSDETLSQNLAWLCIATVLALGIGWFGSNLLVLEPIKALAKLSGQLAAGDLKARTGLKHSRDELGDLTAAFDRMAQYLEHREQDSKRVNRKLKVLSSRLVEVQESERRAIARELHDEVGQSLTAAQLGLQTSLQADQLSSMRPRLIASSDMLQRVIEQVHDLSLNLRPSMLDDLGLEAALRWYISRQADSSGLRADFRAEPLSRRLEPLVETACFRIVQEALNNVVRHSKAKRFSVELNLDAERLCLLVKDDGVGFDVQAKREQAVRGSSLGLLSMAERASLAGGQLEMESGNGHGTEVRASFPLRWRTDD